MGNYTNIGREYRHSNPEKNMTNPTPTIIFTMGLPAAGKSTWVGQNLAATHNIIDADAVKESHPHYDPEHPELLHGWSKEITELMWVNALDAGHGLWCIDGTGTNAEKMVRKMNQAAAAGYEIALVYVRCTMETSLERNQGRARKVPEHIIREKALDVATSFSIVSDYIKRHNGKITIIDTDA